MEGADNRKPEKGFRKFGVSAIAQQMLCWLILNFTFGLATQLLIPDLAEMYGLSAAALLNWNTAGSLVGVVCCLICGLMCRKFGCKWIIVITMLGCGVNFAFMTFYGAASGLAIFFNSVASIWYCTIPSTIVIGKWYPRKHAHIMGIVTSIIILGSLVVLPLFNAAINNMGLRIACLIFGIIIIAVAIVFAFWMVESPEKKGLDPDGIPWDEGEEEKYINTVKDNPWTVGKILTNAKFWFASLGWGLELMAMLGISTVGVNILIEKGMSQGMSITVAAFIGLVGFISSIASGYIAERLGFRWASTLWIIVFALGCLFLAIAPYGAIPFMIIGYYLAFSSNGFSNNLSNTIFLKLAGPIYYSFVFTICFTIVQIIRAFASSLFAFSLNHLGGYTGALYICVVLLVLAIILINLAGDKLQTPREGKIGSKKGAEKVEAAAETESNSVDSSQN